LVAGILAASAVIFGWVTITTRPGATGLARRRQRAEQDEQDDLVRRACADLDDEYRRLLSS